ncbi:MAG: hypothetical protein ABJA62_00785 [Luteimonas sp.]
MSKRTLGVCLLALLLVCGALLMHSHQRDSASAIEGATSPAMNGAAQIDGQTTAANARALSIAAKREEAMRTAVSTLHRYLATLAEVDRAKADAFWAGKRPPAVTHEADLRSLKTLQALRIENGLPKPLDSAAVPEALEIPVQLRISREDQSTRRYHGWYRMRRAVADGHWEITSASIDEDSP